MYPIRTILYPTDFSERSSDALPFACSLARDYGARLIMLHVLERPLAMASGVMTAPPPPPPTAEEREELQQKLAAIRPPFVDLRAEHRLEEGDPAPSILEIAKEQHCDLIVMGTHGRTGLGRLLMGSVAEQVVRLAACPVATVKSPLKGSAVASKADADRAVAAPGV
jgi:nucleotide-binding universal stress UspA family protein